MNNEINELELAIEIARKAHFGQIDKVGADYILHPLRVMEQMQSTDEKIVAILHDVVEDSDVTFQQLLDWGVSTKNVMSLRLLTHDKNTLYGNYIRKLAQDSVARQVKLADLKDNSNLDRLPEVTEKDLDRVEKYRRAIAYLEQLNN